MTRADVLRQYDVDTHGVIRSPGKFEGEMLYAPYFYEIALDNGGDGIATDDDPNSPSIFVESEDLAEFPELGDTKEVILSENSVGFVTLEEFK